MKNLSNSFRDSIPFARFTTLAILATAIFFGISEENARAAVELPTISGRKLFTASSQPFQLRALAYSPTPIGDCLPTNATLDVRYIRRDGPIMAAAGANTIRIYGGLRIAANGQFDFGVTRDFLREAASNGLWVVVGTFVAPGMNFADASVRAGIVSAHTNLLNRLRGEENILAYAIGNEVDQYLANTNQLMQWYTLVDEIARAMKQAQGGGSGPGFGPYMTSVNGIFNTNIVNKPILPASNVATNVDFWGANIYTGPTLGSVFLEIAKTTTKPFWIAEMGIDSFDSLNGVEDQSSQAKCAEALWEQVLAHRDLVFGAVLGFYPDEWWKDPHGSCSVQDTGGGAFGNGPDNYISDEWLGIVKVSPMAGSIDAISPKQAYYEIQRLWGGGCPCVTGAVVVPFLSKYDAIDKNTNAFNNYAGYDYSFFDGDGVPVVRADAVGASGNPGDRGLHATLTQPAGSRFGFFGITETLFPDSLTNLTGVTGVNLSSFDTLVFDAWLGSAGSSNRWRIRLEDTDFANEFQNINLDIPPLTTNVQSFTFPLSTFANSSAKVVDISRVAQIVFQINVPQSAALPAPLKVDLVIDNMRIFKSVSTNAPFLAALTQSPQVGWNTETTLQFPAAFGQDYFVQFRDTFGSGGWTNLPGFPHDRGCAIDRARMGNRFYRIVRSPATER